MGTILSGINDTKMLPSGATWFVPSFVDLWFIGILFLLAASNFALKLLGDADVGWHIRDGEQILQTHAIPRVDSFSATLNGQPWFAWEWLYDAGIAFIHAHAGLNGVVFFTAVVVAATFAFALRSALKAGANLPVAIFLLGLSLAASTIHLLARPHVVSWLLAVVWFSVLHTGASSVDQADHKRIYWLPFLMLLWANLHGGFLLGFVFLAIYVADAAFVYWRTRELAARHLAANWLKQLALASGLTFLASLINPYGISLYAHIYRYLGDRFLMDHIDEFQSPNFHGIAQRCFALLLLITLCALAARRQRMRLAEGLVILFAVYSGLYSSRNLPVSSLLLALVIAPLLSREIAEAGGNTLMMAHLRAALHSFDGFASRVTTLERGFRGHFWPVLTTSIGLWACLHGGELGSHRLMNAHFNEARFPVHAVQIIQQRGIKEPIFAPDYWGGYLIYTLYPANKVFVDDRHDFYGSDFFRQYMTTVHVEPGWSKLLDDLHVEWVLVPNGSPLDNILKETPAWNLDYQDKTATLFRRIGK